jgi:energy-coupling factor transporter ATP-binding protein EcfA2
VGGTVIAIRKFRSKVFTAEELVRRGMLSARILGELRDAIEARRTILISGGTGTGKTTLLNALCAFIPPADRIVILEDTAEVDLTAPNLVRLEARRAQPDVPAISIRDLLRQTLRLRIAGLRRKGFTLERIRPLLRPMRREIQRHREELLNGGCRLYLLTDGRTNHFEEQPARIIELLKSFRTPAVLMSLGDAAECVTGFQKRARGRASHDRIRTQLKLF